MELLNMNDLKKLVEEREFPAVSIFIPTHRMGDQVQQDPIRFKNKLVEVERLLTERGFKRDEINKVLGEAHKLQQDKGFWFHQSDALAVFISPGETFYYRVPARFDELVVVNKRYHLKPLLQLLLGEGRFFILGLDLNETRLFECTKYNFTPREIINAPTSLNEAMKYDDPEKSLQFHSETAGATSTTGRLRTPMYFGQGIGKDGSYDKMKIQRFFEMLNNGIYDTLKTENDPLVLAGVDYLVPIYQKVNSYHAVTEHSVTVNPEGISLEELHQKALRIVEPIFKNVRDKDKQKYQQFIGNALASNDLSEIVKAAYHKRIDSLFVNINENKWGRFDAEDNRVLNYENHVENSEDLLDFAAAYTLINGGRVYAVSKSQMPGKKPAAAVFRY